MTPYSAPALARSAAMVRHAGQPRLGGAPLQARGLIYGTMLRQANMLAFADAFWVMAILFLAVVPLMFLMRKAGPARGPVMVE